MTVPIRYRGQTLGVFAFTLASSRPARPRDIALLQALADQAAVAVRVGRAPEYGRGGALARHEARGARVRAASTARWRQRVERALERLATSPGPDAALGEVLSETVEQFGATGGSIWRAAANGISRLVLTFENGEVRSAGASDNPGFEPPARAPRIRLELRRGEVRIDDEATIRTHPAYAPFRLYLERQQIRSLAVVPMYLGESLQGALTLRFLDHRRLTPEEIELLATFANQAVLAAEFARLSRASRAVAVSEERSRLARDVHDTVAQGLTAVIRQLECASAETTDERVMQHVRLALDTARDTLVEARRSIQGLRPVLCGGQRFAAGIDAVIQRSRALSMADVRVTIRGHHATVPAEVHSELLLILQEALTNAIRHSKATAVDVEVWTGEGVVRLGVRDDGFGFDPSSVACGLGLSSMHERAERIGATLTITSERGRGTQVVVQWSNAGLSRAWTPVL